MSAHVYSPLRKPLVHGDKTMHDITNDVCGSIEGKPSLLWWVGFLVSGAVALMGILLYGLVLLGSWWWDDQRSLLPVALQNWLIVGYLAFYGLDLWVLSRPVLATVHLVFFVSAVKLYSRKGRRDERGRNDYGPDFARAHAFRAGALATATDRAFEPELLKSVKAAEGLARKANERERLHISACRAWLDGDWERGTESWGRASIDYPRDLLATCSRGR